MPQGESSNLWLNLTRSSQVAWAGLNSKKGRGNKRKGSGKVVRTSGVGEAGDEESYVEGSEEVEEMNQRNTMRGKDATLLKVITGQNLHQIISQRYIFLRPEMDFLSLHPSTL